ncbi:YycC family protein [Paenibacillus lupini]|jgi:plasmid maintenance system antidote protein VapI|uniref:YycC family protein n=1 Tax=Paenibacillus lupini TaxID=1450204 RepID=UPI001420480B|nr:YycC family protein [Paenibacillus lupini]NIK26266.1 plasmid maintenance system antidote protein VapI [Paenibacillus lupini]
MTQPLQISADTAIKLSKQLGVPIEHLMHMPKHILLQKLTELAKAEAEANKPSDSAPGSEESSS